MDKKFYVVETTSEKEWEINHGFHLVKAVSEEDVREIIKTTIKETIVNINTIGEELKETGVKTPLGKISTLISSQEM